MSKNPVKHIVIKYPGTFKEKEVISITSGVSVSDVLTALDCSHRAYFLGNPSDLEIDLQRTDKLYPLVEDGTCLCVCALLSVDITKP